MISSQRGAAIGTYVSRGEDFLKLKAADGTLLGGIDSTGTGYGSLEIPPPPTIESINLMSKLPICLTQNAPVQYIDPLNGSDSNDGCSWGSAKQYVKTAWLALTNASTELGRTNAGGTIYYTDSGFGTLWDAAGNRAAIIGPNDPNWSSCTTNPCTINGISWVKQSPISMIGIGCTGAAQSGLGPKAGTCYVQFGVNDTTTPKVGLQISGTNVSMLFDGMAILNVDMPVQLGVASNGSVFNINTAGISFENFIFAPRDGCSTQQMQRQGPGVWLGYVFETYFRNGAISGCAYSESWSITSVSRVSNTSTYTLSSAHNMSSGDFVFIDGVADSTFNATAIGITVIDSTHFSITQNLPNATSTGGTAFSIGSAAVLANGGGGPGAGLVSFINTHFNAGGVKYTGTSGGSAVRIDWDSISEGLKTDDALFWGIGFNFAGQLQGPIDSQTQADAGSNVATIRAGSAAVGKVMFTGTITGLASAGAPYAAHQTFPATQGFATAEYTGGTGVFGDKLFGRYDDWRHGGLYVHLYSNLVSTNPANWSGAAVTGVPGPYATQSGGDTSAGSVTNQTPIFGSVTKTVNNGDWVIAKGIWSYLAIGTPGGTNQPWNLKISGASCTAQLIDPRDPQTTSLTNIGIAFGEMGVVAQPGLWEASGGVFMVYSPGGSQTCTITFSGPGVSAAGNEIAYYNPTLQYVPATDLGFFAVTQMAMYEPPFSSNCPAGALCAEAPNLMSLGNNTGFGNGSSGVGVTTTAQGTGTGPATPQTVVKYMEIDISGTKYWIPLVQ